ncbi:uncharacterized protein LOC126297507 [Schistocerca gregaria]|uniref:uncharacterized protein LOC126297507 n=1 Tax=Schistocerca gregaria TaxID=7010 RepID=UPI00211E2D47|nr:uncharacterized protein LOC126297507 [Schistocerca gregaria]
MEPLLRKRSDCRAWATLRESPSSKLVAVAVCLFVRPSVSPPSPEDSRPPPSCRHRPASCPERFFDPLSPPAGGAAAPRATAAAVFAPSRAPPLCPYPPPISFSPLPPLLRPPSHGAHLPPPVPSTLPSLSTPLLGHFRL